MRSSRPGSSSRASDRSSEHQAADGSPGKSKPADALQPTKSIGRRPKRGSKASQAKAEALRQDVKPSDITAEMAAERMEEVAGTRMGPTEMVGGGR